MRLDEEVLMDFFREHINVTVSIVSAGNCSGDNDNYRIGFIKVNTKQ